MHSLQDIIEITFEQRANLNPHTVTPATRDTILEVIELLDQGKLRVAEKIAEHWQVNEWVKKAVLLYFTITETQMIEMGGDRYFDKVPLKHAQFSEEHFLQQGARIVPHACVRKGSFIAPKTIVMPAFINIGAYVDTGSMIDTWATVGSCAQIGKNVHLSGGAGIGGVLEPLQANPTIIEDDVFIGARSEIVEGVRVEQGAVIGMGVFIGQSTRIFDRESGEVFYGRVPAGAVVVAGNLPDKKNQCSLYAAIIVKRVDEKTRSKTSLNELLRI